MSQPWFHLLRLHQPAGFLLLLFPCLWGLSLHGGFSVQLVILFGIGAWAMRSAGCIYNDIVDCSVDRHVARTQTRPLACGSLSAKHGVACIIALLGIAGSVFCCLNKEAQAWSFAALPLVALYPWMKRITFWPQFFLGLTFNWGLFVGQAAAGHKVASHTLCLYGSSILWTLFYDTVYAYQDYRDDVRIGVKSSAVWLGITGPRPVLFLAFFWFGMIVLWGAWGSVHGKNWIFFLILCAVAVHGVWQLWTIQLADQRNCGVRFASNRWVGFLLFLSLLWG